VLVTFGIGGAAATFWWASSTATGAALEGIDRTRIIGSIGFTTALLVLEGVLFTRALLTHRTHMGRRTISEAVT
jgi:hypothetical protein